MRPDSVLHTLHQAGFEAWYVGGCVRDLLRGGGSDAQIAARWADAMWVKPVAHGLNIDAFARPSRTMSRIGG